MTMIMNNRTERSSDEQIKTIHLLKKHITLQYNAEKNNKMNSSTYSFFTLIFLSNASLVIYPHSTLSFSPSFCRTLLILATKTQRAKIGNCHSLKLLFPTDITRLTTENLLLILAQQID